MACNFTPSRTGTSEREKSQRMTRLSKSITHGEWREQGTRQQQLVKGEKKL